MIVDPTKLQTAILQAMREINDACLTLRNEGLQVLLPETVECEARLVTDVNAVSRTETKSENDGSSVTLREHLADDTETVTRDDGTVVTTTAPTSGVESTTITHPGVQTASSGGDSSTEDVYYTYEEA